MSTEIANKIINCPNGYTQESLELAKAYIELQIKIIAEIDSLTVWSDRGYIKKSEVMDILCNSKP